MHFLDNRREFIMLFDALVASSITRLSPVWPAPDCQPKS
jgi:hypothetical protein